MDIIESAIKIVKQNYDPPYAFCNQDRVKTDLILFFADILEEIIKILQQNLPDEVTAGRVRRAAEQSGLINTARK